MRSVLNEVVTRSKDVTRTDRYPCQHLRKLRYRNELTIQRSHNSCNLSFTHFVDLLLDFVSSVGYSPSTIMVDTLELVVMYIVSESK